MSTLKTLGSVLKELSKNPKNLSRVANYNEISEEEWKLQQFVKDKYGMENGLPTVDLLDLLPNIDETLDPYTFMEAQAHITDMALLKGLARQIPDCRFLEIGSWRGETIANVAQVARECVSLSLSSDELRQMGTPDYSAPNTNLFSRGLPNVSLVAHNSLTFDFKPWHKSFDLVFVDGDHSFQGVLSDTRNAFSVLRDSNSVIVWHDYGTTPENTAWTVLAGILEGCPPEKRNRLFRVSNTLCAIYIDRDLPTRFIRYLEVPNKTFTVQVKAHKGLPVDL